MADQPQQPPVTDPYSVRETVCDGQFNVSITGNLATLTFTHMRPNPGPMFAEGRIETTAVVRARIVTTLDNLVALRELLNRVIQEPGTPVPAAGGPTRH
jgi:hypothetical protein